MQDKTVAGLGATQAQVDESLDDESLEDDDGVEGEMDDAAKELPTKGASMDIINESRISPVPISAQDPANLKESSENSGSDEEDKNEDTQMGESDGDSDAFF